MPLLISVMGAQDREVNSKVTTAPKLKVEDKDRVNNSRRIKIVKIQSISCKLHSIGSHMQKCLLSK